MENPIQPEVRLVNAAEPLSLCRCGRSPALPDCLRACPRALRYTAKRQQYVLLCRCGRSKNGPFCDGSHNRPVQGLLARWRRFWQGL